MGGRDRRRGAARPADTAAALAISRAVACVTRAQAALRAADVREIDRECMAEAFQGTDGDRHPAWKVMMNDASGSNYGILVLGHDSGNDLIELDPPAQTAVVTRPAATAPLIGRDVVPQQRSQPPAAEPASPTARQ